MKKNTLLLLAIAGGALLFLAMRKKDQPKKRDYLLEVPEPTSITAQQFEVKEAPGLLERLGPVIKNVVKKVKEKRAAKKKIGFPDLY